MMKKYSLFFILLAIFILPGMIFSEEFSNKTYLKFKKGMVRVKKANGRWVKAVTNMELGIGDTIKTLSNGRATVVLAGTAFLKVKPKSELIIPKDKSNTSEKVSLVKLATGVLWAHAKKEKNSLKVATPQAICGVRGTEFIVQAGRDFMRLIVTQGAVAFVPTVKGIAPKAKLVQKGQQIFFKPSVAKKQAEELKKKEKAKKKEEKKKEEPAPKAKEEQPAAPNAEEKQSPEEQPAIESPTDIFNKAVDEMLETSGIAPESSFEDVATKIAGTVSDNTGISVQTIDNTAQTLTESMTGNFESSTSIDPTDSIQQVTDYVNDVIDNTTSDTKTETTPDVTVNTATQYGQVKVSW